MSRRREVVLGIDSSTQSTKVVAVALESGDVLAEGRAPHTGADTQDPRDWWSALETAVHVARRDEFEVRGLSVGGQQHGLVTLDRDGEPVRPASLWNNVDAAEDAERLNGAADFPAAVGSRLVASFTIAKVAHLARVAPTDLKRVHAICLPHDYLNLRLTGLLATDRSDASGSGWWSPATGEIRRDLLALAAGDTFAESVTLPAVLGPGDVAGTLSPDAAEMLGVSPGIPVGAGAGDNAAAALGIGASGAELCISLGTSGVAYAVSDRPTADPSGEVAGFADATGRYLPLACMINCTRVVGEFARIFGMTVVQALDIAENVAPGAAGLLMLPYLGGERTPNLPGARATLEGITNENVGRDNILRAAVDGVAAGLAYCYEALRRQQIDRAGMTLVGGGSHHACWQHAIADATGLDVQVRGGGEHVARGAAIQIAAILRHEAVSDLAARWRPEVIATAEADPHKTGAFRPAERRAMIERLKSA